MREAGSAKAFGPLLRAFRTDAGLTQERLAERCGLSRRGIADLERGARLTPQISTLERLAAGLQLSQAQRDRLIGAARQSGRTLRDAELGNEPQSPVREFVGRDAELAALRAAAERALNGHGVCAFIAGEPGIGKTALCEQFALYASSQGMRTLVGRCYEDPSLSPPYAPFLEALRSCVRTLKTDALRTHVGQNAVDLVRLLPELAQRLPIHPSEHRHGEDERWRLLSAVSEFLRSVAEARPLALILEDLHWADLGTLDLLRYLMRHLAGARLVVIGTYRHTEIERDHVLADVLAESRRRQDAARIDLPGLTEREVQLLAERTVNRLVSEVSGANLHRLTEGNPLFVGEIVRYMIEAGVSGHLEEAASDSVLVPRLPLGLRETIGSRLARLSQTCRDVLAIGSVLGGDFELDTLRRVANLPDEDVLTALEEAHRARIVDDISEVREVRFRFAHALFRETLYLDLFTPRRVILHKRVALALESRYADDLEEHAAELTEHYQRSGDPGDLDRALRYAELAANRAVRVSAYGEAARHLRTALALQSGSTRDSLEKRCDLLMRLGQAMVGAGELEVVSNEVAPEALKLAETLDDNPRAFQACFLAGEALVARCGISSCGTPEFMYWVEQIQRYAGVDPTSQALAFTARGSALTGAGDEHGARACSRRAVELAREAPGRGVFHIVARYDIEPWMWGAADQAQRLLLAEELLESGQRVLGGTSGGHYYNTIHFIQFAVGDVLLTCGQRERAEALWTSDLKERLEYPWSGLVAERVQLILCCLDGHLEEALELATAHVHSAESLGATPFGRENAAVYLRRSQLYLGRADEALAGFHPELDAARPEDQPVSGLWGMFAAQRAVCLAHAGRKDDGQAVLERFLRVRDPLNAVEELPLPTAVALLELATLLGDRSTAAALAKPLSVAADMVAADGTLTVIARHLAAACVLNGEYHRARGYYEQALRVAEKVRFRPEVALARVHLADVELQLANVRKASQLLDLATPELQAMHMQPALERATALRSLATAVFR